MAVGPGALIGPYVVYVGDAATTALPADIMSGGTSLVQPVPADYEPVGYARIPARGFLGAGACAVKVASTYHRRQAADAIAADAVYLVSRMWTAEVSVLDITPETLTVLTGRALPAQVPVGARNVPGYQSITLANADETPGEEAPRRAVIVRGRVADRGVGAWYVTHASLEVEQIDTTPKRDADAPWMFRARSTAASTVQYLVQV